MPKNRVKLGLMGAAALVATLAPAQAQRPEPAAVRSADRTPVPIRRIEGVRTTMRDGVVLVSDIWLPAAEGRYPVLLMQSPYRMRTMRPFVELAEFYAGHGYAVAIQDSRGTGGSQGEFDFLFQEAQDGFDSIESLATQDWANGRLCMLGYSYLGTVQLLAARERPPRLACIAPTAPAGRYHEEMPTVQGAFMLHWGLNWLRTWADDTESGPNQAEVDWDAALAHRPLITLDEAVIGRENRLYRQFLENDTLNAYWRRISFTAEDFDRIDLPMMLTTGWFDGDQHGTLYYWRGFEARRERPRDAYLTIGPWNHAQTFMGGRDRMGAMPLPANSILDNRAMRLAFFDHYLKQTGPKPAWARVTLFVTGADIWRTFDALPVPDEARRRLYLSGGGDANTLDGDGRLSWDRPGEEPADEYVYDPRNPVELNFMKTGLFGDLRNEPQAREDVLVYSTGPLAESVEVIGTVTMELYAASDARDTDFTAAISDVGPDGRAIILGARPVGIVRARYRRGREAEPVLLTPGEVERYEIDLGAIGHRFLPGHRIRVEISSSAAPFFNPNQNSGNPVATDTEWRTARQTVFHDTARPSALLLPVYEAE
ncbi:CocE/NonD family hydrolase [Sphingosinicella terrae]|uniref:CocE/NonD family hydrolase n=1 Tax=Sphingosinicella terrae TaxID=2172047 RepID=UPI0013B3783E|nr:CocE/NonD family hydrolase [Sphingosinicella terrae]